MFKGVRFLRYPAGVTSRGVGHHNHGFFPVLFAGSVLGNYLSNAEGMFDLSALREYTLSRQIHVFLMGIAVGVGIGYTFYPLYAPYIDGIIDGLLGKESCDNDAESEDQNRGWSRWLKRRKGYGGKSDYT